MILIASAILIILMFYGLPLWLVLIGAASIGYISAETEMLALMLEIWRLTDLPLLMALPLFTLAGFWLSATNTATRLMNVVDAWFGWLPGGLVWISLITMALFTALTGAAGVTIVALGALLLKALKTAGYPEKYSLGLVTAGGSLGLLLPPALPLILYGVVVQQLATGPAVTFQALFLAGILPTLLMIALLGAYGLKFSPKTGAQFSGRQALKVTFQALPEILLPVFIFASIATGFVAISEVAILTVIYVLIIEGLIYRELNFSALKTESLKALSMTGNLLLVLAAAYAFSNVLLDADVPGQLISLIQSLDLGVIGFLALTNIMLLFAGALIDIFACIVLLVPLLLPIALHFNIHPVHFGMIMLANLQLGYLTPPVGLNLFIASLRFKTPIETLIGTVKMPFLLLLIAVLMITYLPLL